jgi:hypothetical protein
VLRGTPSLIHDSVSPSLMICQDGPLVVKSAADDIVSRLSSVVRRGSPSLIHDSVSPSLLIVCDHGLVSQTIVSRVKVHAVTD